MVAERPALAIVLAPGSRITRLGVCGDALPRSSLPATEVPLNSGSAATASALVLSAAHHLSISSSALKRYFLVVVEPSSAFPRSARDVLCGAALGLLGMPRVLFVPAASAVVLAAGADGVPHVIVDVGWAASRVLVGGIVTSVAAIGLRDVNQALLDGGAVVAEGDIDCADELRAISCVFRSSSNNSADTLVGDFTKDGHVVVPAQLRISAPEALFDTDDGTCTRTLAV
jgi:hypothetical protein